MCQIPHEVFSLYGPMDQWDCVREFAPAGTYRYYAPQGELVTFDYTPTAGATSTYCLHADALGSVRMITDSTGVSVGHYEYDAWGNLLASSSDISFGFNYRFVGALGVRWDATLGMYYCRNRFYDPQTQRFISRDPVGIQGSAKPYTYCYNSPTTLIDPAGLAPVPVPLPSPTTSPATSSAIYANGNSGTPSGGGGFPWWLVPVIGVPVGGAGGAGGTLGFGGATAAFILEELLRRAAAGKSGGGPKPPRQAPVEPKTPTGGPSGKSGGSGGGDQDGPPESCDYGNECNLKSSDSHWNLLSPVRCFYECDDGYTFYIDLSKEEATYREGLGSKIVDARGCYLKAIPPVDDWPIPWGRMRP